MHTNRKVGYLERTCRRECVRALVSGRSCFRLAGECVHICVCIRMYRYASLYRTPLNQNTRYTRRYSDDGTLLLDWIVLILTGIHDTPDTLSHSRPFWFNETPLYIPCTWLSAVFWCILRYVRLIWNVCRIGHKKIKFLARAPTHVYSFKRFWHMQ